jgi:5-methyltetrahydrofolate--homocysteine methyltransferase
VLPLVAEYKTAVIGLAMDDKGIPATPAERLEVAKKILRRAAEFGIPPEDVLIDCLAMTVGADSQAGQITLDSIRLIKQELGSNMTLGVSNISHGLPERDVVTQTFLIMALQSGVNCPIIDVGKMRPAILATDLLLGRDEYASRYIKDFKKRQKRLEAQAK